MPVITPPRRPIARPRPTVQRLRATGLAQPSPWLLAPATAAVAQTTPHLLMVEAAWGASLRADPGTWTWTDISADVRGTEGVTIHRGRMDESSETSAASVSLVLKDYAGQYTPRNPNSPNWPYVRQNTPLRVSVNVGDGSYVRGVVYVDEWVTSWDEFIDLPIVEVSASGILQRLQAPTSTPPRSPLTRYLSGQAGSDFLPASTVPVAYWTFEDGNDATAAAEFFGGRQIVPSGTVRFGSTSGAKGSASVVSVSSSSAQTSIGANIPHYTATGAFMIVAMLSVPQAPGGTITLLDWWATGTQVNHWRITLSAALLLKLEAYSSAGGEVLGATGVTLPASTLGTELLFAGIAAQNGSALDWQVLADTYTDSGSLASTTCPTLLSWSYLAGAELDGGSFGQVAIYSTPITRAALASQFATGASAKGAFESLAESPAERFARLCQEEAVPYTVFGDPAASTQVMAAQPTGDFVALVRESEAAGGLITDGMYAGLTFRMREARYNIPATLTLDASDQLAPGFRPVEDDQLRRNSWTVNRSGGSSGQYTDKTGPQGTDAVGVYADTGSVNVIDSQLVNQAAWRVHLGTVEAMRYPTVTLNLRRAPELIPQWRACGIGSRITLTNLPSQHGGTTDLDLIIEGYTETITAVSWTVDVNCSSYEPWRAAVIQDVVNTFRLDTAGSSLTTSAGAADATLSVTTASGPLWTTTAAYPADFPFDVDVDGEQVTVTAVAANQLVANPYFESPTNASNWAGANNATLVADSAQAHEGTQSLKVTPDGVTAVPQAQSDEFGVTVGRTYTLHGWVRSAAGGDTLVLAIFWFDSGHNFLSSSQISAAPPAATWTEYGPQTFTAPANAVYGRAVSNNPATPLATHTWRLDEVTVTDATGQTFTVTRAVNGITKAHSSGAAVKLWRPPVIPL